MLLIQAWDSSIPVRFGASCAFAHCRRRPWRRRRPRVHVSCPTERPSVAARARCPLLFGRTASATVEGDEMQGLMQDHPLTLPHFFWRAEHLYADKGVTTSTAAGLEHET